MFLLQSLQSCLASLSLNSVRLCRPTNFPPISSSLCSRSLLMVSFSRCVRRAWCEERRPQMSSRSRCRSERGCVSATPQGAGSASRHLGSVYYHGGWQQMLCFSCVHPLIILSLSLSLSLSFPFSFSFSFFLSFAWWGFLLRCMIILLTFTRRFILFIC